MPIKGLSDRGLSFPEIGQVRKGAAKTENKPGKDLSYFRVIFDEREQKAADQFKQIYGDQPTWFRIILPFDEIERMWDPYLEAYTAGRMVARADGEFYIYLIDAETGEILVKNGLDLKTNAPRSYVEDKPCGYYVDGGGKRKPIYCKPSGRLKVIIPEFARAAYLTVLTTSIHDIINISDQLRAFKTLNDGRLAGIPFIIRRRPRNISIPKDDGSRVRMVKWLISIEADPEWVKARLQETKRLALPGEGLALPETSIHPDESLPTDYDEEEIQDGEYHEQPQPETRQEVSTSVGLPTNGHIRPYDLETLKSKLQLKADEKYSKAKLTDKQIGLIAMLIERAFAGRENADALRHDVQFAIFGHESLKDAPGPLLMAALNDWLKPAQDSGGDYHPDPVAVTEINRIVTESLVKEGQENLF